VPTNSTSRDIQRNPRNQNKSLKYIYFLSFNVQRGIVKAMYSWGYI
jgi:hypothetical protein